MRHKLISSLTLIWAVAVCACESLDSLSLCLRSGAPGNAEGLQRRRGYATRWCGDDVTYVRRPGTMEDGWKAMGFDCGLTDGAPIACELHPDFASA